MSSDDPLALPRGKGQGRASGDDPLALPKGRVSGVDPLALPDLYFICISNSFSLHPLSAILRILFFLIRNMFMNLENQEYCNHSISSYLSASAAYRKGCMGRTRMSLLLD